MNDKWNNFKWLYVFLYDINIYIYINVWFSFFRLKAIKVSNNIRDLLGKQLWSNVAAKNNECVRINYSMKKFELEKIFESWKLRFDRKRPMFALKCNIIE